MSEKDMIIQELRRENAELRAKIPKWISVEDRLPDAFTPVIVCRPGNDVAHIVEQGCKDVMDWWKVYGTRTKKVTHWMPLPEPPEEVAN